MPTLKASIEALAHEFATGVLVAVRGASLEEILNGAAPARRGPGRPRGSVSTAPRARGGKRVRRSANDIAATADGIVAFVAKHPKGIRGEQIRKELGIAKNQWLKPLGLALGSRKLRKTGEKRSTTYFPR
jgi:hypothetical protein